MGLTYQEEVTIPFDMVDVKQEIKLPDFISYCLGVSGRQSEDWVAVTSMFFRNLA
ncbi:Acyl-ACP thioesterase [Streptococcus suis 05ZYH33]|nr:Acyl-ACP thioesterase [Streptococcus suis 05ZYH33]